MAQNLMSIEQLSEYVGVPVQTIYRWNMLGTGPKHIKVGRYVRYRPEDVERWLAERQSGAA